MKLKKAKRECDTITADLGAFSNPEDLALTLENACYQTPKALSGLCQAGHG